MRMRSGKILGSKTQITKLTSISALAALENEASEAPSNESAADPEAKPSE
jgi:hypothetical protein